MENSTLKEVIKSFGNISERWASLLKNNLLKIEKNGFTLFIPGKNTDDYGCFLVNSIYGHDCIAYDSRSTHSYYILEGNGIFEINGNEMNVSAGDIIHIKPNEIFYYKGNMKMIEEIIPNFEAKHFHILEEVNYDSFTESSSKKQSI